MRLCLLLLHFFFINCEFRPQWLCGAQIVHLKRKQVSQGPDAWGKQSSDAQVRLYLGNNLVLLGQNFWPAKKEFILKNFLCGGPELWGLVDHLQDKSADFLVGGDMILPTEFF